MKKPQSSNRSFGITFFIVFLAIGLWPFLSSGELRIWPVVISLIFLILGLLDSKILTPLNNLWGKSGELNRQGAYIFIECGVYSGA